MINAYASKNRDADTATTFFRQAVENTGMRLRKVITDKGPVYPPALAVMLLDAKHVAHKG